jgi:homopolymeric O-antigen transport system permease protein
LAVETEPAIGLRLRPAVPTALPPRVQRIQPSKGFIPVDLAEIWRYRELLHRLVFRDVKARYKQTYLGPLWAILRPVISMVLMSAVFGGLAGFTSGTDVPYPLFLYSGILVWTYFSSALTGTGSSLLSYSGLLGKAYFPRLYAPFAAAAAPLVDFALSMTVVFGLFGYFGRWPSWHIVFMPFFVIGAMIGALGVGLWLAGISVRYRDVPFTVPYIVQLWFYATPVLYPVSKLPKPYSSLLALNPMTSVVEGFRWSLLGMTPPNIPVLVGSSLFALLLFVGGLFHFRRTERTIVDLM